MSAKSLSPRAKVLLSRAGVLLFYLALWGVLARIVHQPLLLPAPGEGSSSSWFTRRASTAQTVR